jgi:hypothetical protein
MANNQTSFGPTIVPSEKDVSKGAAGFANQMSTINLFRKGFMLQDNFDEPTYLTFYIDFDFDSQMTDDMTSLPASPLFDDGTTAGEVKTSAVQYLTQKYSGGTADYLTQFINTLRYITNDTPWYFQTISGLDKMWANISDKGLKTGMIGSDIVLTIGCLEAIDLRIMQLAEYYQKAAFDNKFMRYQLPDNLRHFNMKIYIGEVRDIYSNLNAADGKIQTTDMIVSSARSVTGRPDPTAADQSNAATNMRMNSFYYVYFDCYQCEFDFSPMLGGQGGKFKASTEEEPYSSSFNIKIGRFEVAGGFGPNNYSSNLYRDKYLDSGERAQLGQSITDSVISANAAQLGRENASLLSIAQALGPFSNVVQSALFEAERGLNKLLATPNRFINSALSEIQRSVERGKLGGNLYGGSSAEEPGPTELNNIYGPPPRTVPGPKRLGNIYGF